MTYWTHYNPVRILSGSGRFNELPQLLPSDGSKWLLVTTQGFTKRGVTARVIDLVQGLALTVYDEVSPNPDLDELERRTEQFKPDGISGIIALGGGSVMDASKVLAVTLLSKLPQPLTTTLRQSQEQNWHVKLPLIVIPTTSGTGAEVTPFATVWDSIAHKKYSVFGDKLFPDVAILDTDLTLTLPPNETLHSGLDAISHALESLWNKNKTPISELCAWQSLALSSRALSIVYEHSENIEARKQMQQASLLAGMSISQTKTAIAHSISYPLTSHFGVPHGLACSFTLPKLIAIFCDRAHFLPDRRNVLDEVKETLDRFDLPKRIKEYASVPQLNSLRGQPLDASRFGNYIYNNIEVGELFDCS